MSLKMIGYDKVCKEEHEILIGKHEVVLYEPTVRQWGAYRNLDIDNQYKNNIFGLHVYIVGLISPKSLEYFSIMTNEEISILIDKCLKVMGGGFDALVDKEVVLTEGRSTAETKTYLNYSYVVAKGIKKLNMTPNEVLNMSYFKMEELLHGVKAIEAEDNLLKMQVQNSGLLLKSKDGAKRYKSMQKEFLNVVKELGIKIITTVPDFGWMDVYKNKEKKKNKKG